VLSPFVRQNLRPFLAKPSTQDLKILMELIDAGKISPVIDRTYPLAAALPRFVIWSWAMPGARW
jgi:NADPH:quinone reductase-like Zn-dependent oxidoreductase